MFDRSQYELIDFGDGRKLERFGDVVLDRPSPAALVTTRQNRAAWDEVHARFVRDEVDRVEWRIVKPLPESWCIDRDFGRFELKPTPFGHVGIFPEQAGNWNWIRKNMQRTGKPLNVLNLFAYTGGSTLAAASAGAKVVHVDSARNIVNWARRNAELSGLGGLPIRWIVEDARKFVQREIRRGNRYDAVILDPPAYGHGAKGERWSIGEHLSGLLADCAMLTCDNLQLVLLTCHSAGFEAAELSRLLNQTILANRRQPPTTGSLDLIDRGGRKLNCGIFARWAS